MSQDSEAGALERVAVEYSVYLIDSEDDDCQVLDALVESVQKPGRSKDGRAGGGASSATKRPATGQPATRM